MRPMTLNERAMAALLRSLSGANCNRLRVGGIRDARRRIRALDDDAIDDETATFIVEAFACARSILASQAVDGIDRTPCRDRPLTGHAARGLKIAAARDKQERAALYLEACAQFGHRELSRVFRRLRQRGYIVGDGRICRLTDKGRTALARSVA